MSIIKGQMNFSEVASRGPDTTTPKAPVESVVETEDEPKGGQLYRGDKYLDQELDRLADQLGSYRLAKIHLGLPVDDEASPDDTPSLQGVVSRGNVDIATAASRQPKIDGFERAVIEATPTRKELISKALLQALKIGNQAISAWNDSSVSKEERTRLGGELDGAIQKLQQLHDREVQ